MNQDLAGSLPAPPADPLHILPPEILLMLLAGVALLLLALAWLVLRRFLRRRQQAAPPAPPPVMQPPPVATPATSIGTRIEAIERKFLKTKECRDGCHALATAAKGHLGRSTGLDAERMTSPEIMLAVKDVGVGLFMTNLSWLRYGRREPRRKHFVEACAKAREVLA